MASKQKPYRQVVVLISVRDWRMLEQQIEAERSPNDVPFSPHTLIRKAIRSWLGSRRAAGISKIPPRPTP